MPPKKKQTLLLSLNRARAEKLAVSTAREKLKLRQEQKKLVPAEVAVAVHKDRVAYLRAGLLTLPGKYAIRTVGVKTLTESQAVWEEAIREVLTKLAKHDRDSSS